MSKDEHHPLSLQNSLSCIDNSVNLETKHAFRLIKKKKHAFRTIDHWPDRIKE